MNAVVWELGRIALGLLNQQHFAQAIELLDASVEILKGQTFQDNTSPSSSALVVPFFIRENVENGDLLSIKYKAMQQVKKGETFVPIITGFTFNKTHACRHVTPIKNVIEFIARKVSASRSVVLCATVARFHATKSVAR